MKEFFTANKAEIGNSIFAMLTYLTGLLGWVQEEIGMLEHDEFLIDLLKNVISVAVISSVGFLVTKLWKWILPDKK